MDVFEFHYSPHDYFFIFGRVGLWVFTIGVLQATLVPIIHKRLHPFHSISRSSNMFTCFPFEIHISPTQISPIKFSDIKFQFHGVQVKFPSSLATYRAKPCGGVCSTLHAYHGTTEVVLGFFWFENVQQKYDQKRDVKTFHVFLSSANQFVYTSNPSWSGSTANGVELEPGGNIWKEGVPCDSSQVYNNVMKYTIFS